ncbi:ATP-binding cassette domain-containing protein [Lactococcus lactis]|uniref:ATP-binding cassette domain-containing protein n=1 Tax=Lactococcus lactis TaxID=1358 RepID=UPI00288F557F|nr:ATP-binding cassette domain-containing protein [Lactococcus lactis]MDT2863336.1 ATP-binding cassette domain-containing protein [Lactococcus lactis]
MLKLSKLNFLNYKIQEFEILVPGLYGFVGQNGAGKSTFFSILNGDISAKGSIISSRKVMYISNLQSFDKNLKALDYFKLLSESERSSAKKLSELFDINSFIDKKIGKYSLGMLQQFAIIISLASNSEIVIFVNFIVV